MSEERPSNFLLAVTPDSNPATLETFGRCVENVPSVVNQCVALIQLDTDEASAGAMPDVEPERDPGPPAT